MEIEGHPTQDIIEELERRGSLRLAGGTSGPDPDAIRFLTERLGEVGGTWMFVPAQAFDTGFDEYPAT